MREYFLSVAAWLSQGINVIVFAGNEDTTVSARAYLERSRSPFWRWMYMNLNRVFGLLLRQENHCLESHLRDVRRASEVASRV
jgi:hypothetical protein